MNIKDKLQELNVKKQTYIMSLDRARENLSRIESELNTVENSQIFVQAVASNVQSQLSSSIDNIVNLGLATCFPGYTFEMKYIPSRGKTEVSFVVKNGDDIIDPMNQCGGGLINVLELGLRLAVYSISNVNNVLIVDEGFKFLSKSLKSKVAELLHVLSERLNLQFIEITHFEEFSENSDKKILIKKIDGISNTVEENNV